MIAIACATTDERSFRASGAPMMEAIDEGNSLMLRHHRYDSIDVPYNEMLEAATQREDLEAVVFVHQDAVVEGDCDLPGAVRGIFAQHDDVAVIAAAGDRGPREWRDALAVAVVLSPWAAANLRFDPAVGGSADASARDIALQAEENARRALAMRLGVARVWSPPGPAARRRELDARVALARKWRQDRTPGSD